MAQGMAQGIEQGKAQGMAQGKTQGRAEGVKDTLQKIVGRMRAMGLTNAQISEATGLDLRQIEEMSN